ncbi:MAG TPA: hypothetical protein VGK48_28305 [Terriglobia bacterium]|jgi:hypothetical protein
MQTQILTLLAGLALAAQQPVYKAPTPADWAAMSKLPDFSGVWERGGGGGGNAAFGTAPAPAAPRGNPAPAGNRGAAPPRGARGGARGPSFTPEYEARRVAAARTLQPEDNTTANCLPPGMPGIMSQPYPMEFLLTPGKVTIVIEAYTEVRHIFTDGRPLPGDPDPNFFGTSVGHWEGDTLVVDTVGFNDHVELAKGVPHSDKMKIEERFKLTDPDTMATQTTIIDPVALTTPYVTAATLKRHRNWTISEYICEENNRNYVDPNGKAGINLSLPAASRKN